MHLTTIVDGVKGFSGATVTAPDLRAGAALVIAGLQASGRTRIEEIGFIKRGYEDFDKKIRALGGRIRYLQ